ncbi:hypothetical protein E3N88_26871 [Mikania micrantha]|uniref:Uncharacterized protein n=1 Tax=Mikania micrantha TaxID=192012 RepID=A0A5N6MW61_9ASTR|nr:hypothetical protein E3N88_26871 [Mikania micrantha]
MRSMVVDDCHEREPCRIMDYGYHHIAECLEDNNAVIWVNEINWIWGDRSFESICSNLERTCKTEVAEEGEHAKPRVRIDVSDHDLKILMVVAS